MASRYNTNSNTRDRTALFDTPQRMSSPYEKKDRRQQDFNATQQAMLEEQSEEQAGAMFGKIRALKGLSLKMGEEINSSNLTLGQLEDTFGTLQTRLKGTYNKMLVMAQRSGIPLKWWAGVFAVVSLFFLWVWIR